MGSQSQNNIDVAQKNLLESQIIVLQQGELNCTSNKANKNKGKIWGVPCRWRTINPPMLRNNETISSLVMK